MEELKHCPICQKDQFEHFLECTDHTVTKESFQIQNCIHCGFKFTNPRPDKGNIERYYDSEDYISHSNTTKGIINKLYHLVKIRSIGRKTKLVSGLPTKNSRILDIGCGTGDFLLAMKKLGWDIVGIEPNKKAREQALNNCISNIYDESGLGGLASHSFSIVTLWHVLEHVHDLKKRLDEITLLLESGGYALIAVPNLTSWDAKHYGAFWAAYDVPRHLYHFSPENIKSLFQMHQLQHVASYPMKMDAYYVSMLSEKYKKSSLQLIRAFLTGFYSNLKTKNDAEKYSSVIYLFKKK